VGAIILEIRNIKTNVVISWSIQKKNIHLIIDLFQLARASLVLPISLVKASFVARIVSTAFLFFQE
jgi:hypothetical protein